MDYSECLKKFLAEQEGNRQLDCPKITLTPATLEPDWIDACAEPMENVNHPSHYGGADNAYEAIKVIEAWDLGFCLGNTIKYISRAGKKDNNSYLQDLEKAKWYLEREIERVKND